MEENEVKNTIDKKSKTQNTYYGLTINKTDEIFKKLSEEINFCKNNESIAVKSIILKLHADKTPEILIESYPNPPTICNGDFNMLINTYKIDKKGNLYND